jgi:8-oxo-dGTP pyrophosphatase MutT (NUDIX family)
MSSSPSEFSCNVDREGEIYRCTWLGPVEVVALRVRGLAFTEPRKLLLVHGDDGFQIPGGGLESGESTAEALSRELWEEAEATIVRSHRLGAFRIEGVTNNHHDLQDFYWCHITLTSNWVPPHDISERVVVSADDFLDVLPWGRSDPRAEFLLTKALEVDASAW